MASVSSNHRTGKCHWEADPGIGKEKFQRRNFKKGFADPQMHPEGNEAGETAGKPGKRLRALGLFGGKEDEG